MAPTPRPGTRPAARPAVPAAVPVNFLDLNAYGGGDFLPPEGDYAMFFDIRVHAYTKQDGSLGQQMLGVMASLFPLSGGDPHEYFMSMGRKAIASFVPDPETKAWNDLGSARLLPIPGAPAGVLAGLTNWNQMLKSLVDCGMPVEGEGAVDLSDTRAIDGVWVHISHILEPESRKSLRGGNTAEMAEQQQQQGPRKICVVTEIKEDGQPWNGGGGMPEGAEAHAAPAPTAKAAPKVAAKPAAKAAPKAKAAPAPPVEESGDVDPMEAAGASIAGVLEANPAGILLVKLRAEVFSKASATYGDDVAQAVAETMQDEAAVTGLLDELGYKLGGIPKKAQPK